VADVLPFSDCNDNDQDNEDALVVKGKGDSAFTRGYNILSGLELPNNILIRTLIFKMPNEVTFLILLNLQF